MAKQSTNSSDEVFFLFRQLITKLIIPAEALSQLQQNDGYAPGSFKKQSACDYLDIGQTSLRKLIKEGRIPEGYEMCGCLHWNREDLDKYRFEESQKRDNKNVKRVPPRRRKT